MVRVLWADCTESTELSKAFARQGVKIPIRNEARAKRVKESLDDQELSE